MEGIRVVPTRGPQIGGGYLLGGRFVFKYTTTGARNLQEVVSLFRDANFVG